MAGATTADGGRTAADSGRTGRASLQEGATPYDFAGNAVQTPLPSFRSAKPREDNPDVKTPDGSPTPLSTPQPSVTAPPADEIESFYAKPDKVEYTPMMTPEEQARIRDEYYKLAPGESTTEYINRTATKPGKVDEKKARTARTLGALTDVGLLIADMVGLKKGGLVPKRARFAAPAADKAVRENEAMAAKAQKAYDDAMADAARDDARRLAAKRREGDKLINDGLKADARGKFDADKANTTNTNNYNLRVGDAKAKAEGDKLNRKHKEELQEKKIAADAKQGALNRATKIKVANIAHSGDGGNNRIYFSNGRGSISIDRDYVVSKNGRTANPTIRLLVQRLEEKFGGGQGSWQYRVRGMNTKDMYERASSCLKDGQVGQSSDQQLSAFLEEMGPVLPLKFSDGQNVAQKLLGDLYDDITLYED